MRAADQMGSPLVFSAQPLGPVTLTLPLHSLPSKTATINLFCLSQPTASIQVPRRATDIPRTIAVSARTGNGGKESKSEREIEIYRKLTKHGTGVLGSSVAGGAVALLEGDAVANLVELESGGRGLGVAGREVEGLDGDLGISLLDHLGHAVDARGAGADGEGEGEGGDLELHFCGRGVCVFGWMELLVCCDLD